MDNQQTNKTRNAESPDAENLESERSVSEQFASDYLLVAHSIGGIFDLAFDIYRRYFRTLLTTVAILLLPMQTLLYLLSNVWLKPLSYFVDSHPDDAGASMLLIGGGMLIGYPQAGIPGLLSLMLLAVASAPVAAAVADIYRGKKPSWADCYRRVYPQIPRVIMGWIIVVLAFTTVIVMATIVSFIIIIICLLVLKNKAPETLYYIIGLIMLILPYLLGMTLLAFTFGFTTPLVVLEDLPVTLIPSRNWQLVDKRRAFRTWATIVFLPLVFFFVQALMLGSIDSLLNLFSLWSSLRFLIETALTVMLIVFLQPYLLIFINVLYFDFRIQRDCLDIRLLMAQCDSMRLRDNRLIEVSPKDMRS